jgi:long-subunit acyl-CoA synthetase (AMP-forming)
MEQQSTIYSVPVGERQPGESFIYRSPHSKEKLVKPPPDIQTLQDIWADSVKKFADNRYLEDLTYHQVDQQTKRLGSWLQQHKVELLYIHSINRVEWLLVDIACMRYGIVSVALYESFGK